MDFLKKHRFLALISAALVVLSIASALVFCAVKGTLPYTGAAKEWAGESGELFAYISCFLPVNGKTDEKFIHSFNSDIDKKLTEASIQAEEGGNLWKYAYCGSGNVSVSSERGSASVYALGVGGDFFSFHRMKLRSGNYISESDLMHDRVVLDKELAWKLFGAIEVEGMKLTIGGRQFLVAGVVERDTDFASRDSYPDESGLYMAYDVFYELCENGIECYEAVLPNPVSGFAKQLVSESFSSDAEIVEVSSRYSLGHIFKIIGSFGKRSMRTDGAIYPSWENAARLTEDYCALALALAVIFLIEPLCFGIFLAWKYGKAGGGKLWKLTKTLSVKFYDKVNDKLYEREQKAKTK